MLDRLGSHVSVLPTCVHFARSSLVGLLEIVMLMVLAGTHSAASDGVLEINAACAAVGCFPGDTPGYPVQITQSGSYRLTSNLTRSAALDPLAGDTIAIQSSNVQLDLGGFTIRCIGLAGTCVGSGAGVSNDAAAPASRRNVRVRNGTVTGMPESGFRIVGLGTVVEDVNAEANGGNGIEAGDTTSSGARVSRVVARGNGGAGIVVGSRSLIERCVSTGNGSFSLLAVSAGGPTSSGYTSCITDGDNLDINDLGNNGD